jgi:hypothetical protein
MVFGNGDWMPARRGQSWRLRWGRDRHHCAWSRAGHLLGCIQRTGLWGILAGAWAVAGTKLLTGISCFSRKGHERVFV